MKKQPLQRSVQSRNSGSASVHNWQTEPQQQSEAWELPGRLEDLPGTINYEPPPQPNSSEHAHRSRASIDTNSADFKEKLEEARKRSQEIGRELAKSMNYTSPPLQYNIPPLPSKHIYSPSLEYLEELGELPDWILAHVKSAVPKVIPIQGKDSENNFLPNTRFYPSLDFVPFKEWVQTPIPKNSQLSKDWETGDWEAWAGLHRMYTLPWTLSRSVVGMHIREKYGIGGRILPVAHRSEYGSHNMVFTTTKDNFYYISVGIDKIHVLGKFKSVDYFLEHGAIRGPELPEVEERDKFAHNVSVRQRHLLAAFVRVGGDPKNIVAAMIAGKQWWEVFAHDTRLKPLLTPFGGLMAYEQVILKDADCVPPSDYMKKNPM